MQEKVEIITNHFEHFWNYWTKILKNGYCAGSKFRHGGGGYQKWPKKFRRLLWMAPLSKLAKLVNYELRIELGARKSKFD